MDKGDIAYILFVLWILTGLVLSALLNSKLILLITSAIALIGGGIYAAVGFTKLFIRNDYYKRELHRKKD